MTSSSWGTYWVTRRLISSSSYRWMASSVKVGAGMAVSCRDGGGIHDDCAAAQVLEGQGGGHMEEG